MGNPVDQHQKKPSNRTQSRSQSRHQESDERTPLLNGKKHDRSTSSSTRDDDQQHDCDSASHHSDSSDQDTLVSNLGDFVLQPSTLAKAVAEKDIHILQEALSDGNGDIFQALQTDSRKGLQQDQTSEEGKRERHRIYGKNALPEKDLMPFWRFLWDAFNDKVLIILTVAAAVSFGLGLYQDFGPQHNPEEPRVNWVEGVAIMTAIIIVTLTSSINDYSKERQFKALSDTKEVPDVKALRDGKKYKVIKADQVMVGDILHLQAGDILPCDGLLIKVDEEVKVDESDATGESDAISKDVYKGVQASDQSSRSNNDKKDENGSKDGNAKNTDGSNNADPFLLSGSKVLEGEGRYLAIAVGTTSFQGKIFMELRSSQPDETHMQKQLSELAERIAKLASLAGIILFTVLFIRNCIELKTKPDRPSPEKVQGFIQSFVISVTLIVVAVPEGLPLAVTLALAFATKRMTQANLLVRVFEACETMSNANIIVTDKTGTLTRNQMSVVEGTIGGTAFILRDKEDAKAAEMSDDDADASTSRLEHDDEVDKLVENAKTRDELASLFEQNKPVKRIFDEAIAINSTAFEREREGDDVDSPQQKPASGSHQGHAEHSNGHAHEYDADDNEGEGRHIFVGNKTETALLRMIEEDFSDQCERHYTEIRDQADAVWMAPFSSDRKAMATCIQRLDGDGYRLHVKGAAEVIVELCNKRVRLDNKKGQQGGQDTSDDVPVTDLEGGEIKHIQNLIAKYASRSLRTIALAYRDYDEWPPSGTEDSIKYDDVANDLTLLSIPGIEDPLREGVKEAVQKCQKAGVHIIMCTGDNLLTAKAIAQQCGIYTDGEAISGTEWRGLSDEEKREKAPKLQVMARSLPQDKQTLTNSLKDSGRIVGVTGDGTNDALALKDGDVGFSMGQAGTEVAKEASDVIIMDDNFTSIVSAIAWGRCVSDAVRKFLQFQLAVNVTAIIITFVSSVSGGDENSVMNAVQLLWVNLIMDTFAALALATDPADESLLDRKPEPRTRPIITVPMTKMIIFQAAYQTSITLLLHFGGQKLLHPFTKAKTNDTQFGTLVFNVFVWCQIFNMINCRQLRNSLNVFAGLHRNLWLIGILAIMVGGQILIVFVGGTAFDTQAIPISYWIISIVLGLGSFIVGLIARLLPDTPLAWFMTRCRLIQEEDDLPQDSPRSQEKSTHRLEKATNAFQFIHLIRNGRSQARRNWYSWPPHAPEKEEVKHVAEGLVLIPAMTALAVAKRDAPKRDNRRN